MWVKLRDISLNPEWDRKDKAVPITVRILETLICLRTAHAKLRLNKKIKKVDAYAASQLLMYSLFNENEDEEENNKRGRKKKEEDEPPLKEEKN